MRIACLLLLGISALPVAAQPLPTKPARPVGGILDLFRPNPKGPTFPLFEDDVTLLKQQLDQTNPPTGLPDVPSVVQPENDDRYSGSRSARVLPPQRFSPTIAGWSFPIRAKPQAGEFRYIRFAWKKQGGTSMMIQFAHGGIWAHRYEAGRSPHGWPSIRVAERIPGEWTVVTRDLFADFGQFDLTGLALSPLDGQAGYYDHIYLGRTVADLDALPVPRAGMKLAAPLTAEQLTEHFRDLGTADSGTSSRAFWTLLADPERSVPHFAKELKPARLSDRERNQRRSIARWIEDLDADDFATREQAHEALRKLGMAAEQAIRQALENPASLETQRRLGQLVTHLQNKPTPLEPDELRHFRALLILHRLNTPAARKVIAVMGTGDPESILTRAANAYLAGSAR